MLTIFESLTSKTNKMSFFSLNNSIYVQEKKWVHGYSYYKTVLSMKRLKHFFG